MNALDGIILRRELQHRLGVCSETLRRQIANKRLPPPDVYLSAKTQGWNISTLRAAGINIGEQSA